MADLLANKSSNENSLSQNVARVLVIEDDSQDFLYLSELLEESASDKHLLIENAKNFEEALLKATSNYYNLVFLDYRLGYLNGLDVYESFVSENISSPVIFVTGQGSEQIATSALKQGISDYVVKDDLDQELISNLVDKYINHRASVTNINSIIEKKQRKDKFLSSGKQASLTLGSLIHIGKLFRLA